MTSADAVSLTVGIVLITTAGVAIAATRAHRFRQRHRRTEALLTSVARHPAGAATRARYDGHCSHTITAADPYELVLAWLDHRAYCPAATRKNDTR